MPADTTIVGQLVVDAMAGGAAAYAIAKYLLRKAEQRFNQVEDHETRLTVVETAIREIPALAKTVGRVAEDVAFLRGMFQGHERRE